MNAMTDLPHRMSAKSREAYSYTIDYKSVKHYEAIVFTQLKQRQRLVP